MPRPSWRRYSTKPPEFAMRSTASRSCGPQSQRWLPNTSPVRHSLCGRTSGAPRPAPRGRSPARSPSANVRCSRPSMRPSKLNTRASVTYPSANRRGTETRVRIVAGGSRSRIVLFSVVLESGRKGIAQQHDVADLVDGGKRRAPGRIPREEAVSHEPWSLRVADKDRSDDELELVDEVRGQELRVHGRAALDHQALHAASGEVCAQPLHLHRVARVDDGGDGSKSLGRVADA